MTVSIVQQEHSGRFHRATYSKLHRRQSRECPEAFRDAEAVRWLSCRIRVLVWIYVARRGDFSQTSLRATYVATLNLSFCHQVGGEHSKDHHITTSGYELS